ncbi:MAG TPA: fibronectin type III domain-containing protein [Syntrophales bacterium]|nr:fibronectin type III domain-containing protein [Syntrophales bacterium]
MKAARAFLIFLICGLVAAGSLSGCGKKGDPRPTGVTPPAAITDLRVGRTEIGSVILRWTAPEARGGLQKYRIERSELRAKGATCPECPLEYTVIADISVNDQRLSRPGEKGVSYLDSNVKSGYFYTYRVVACDISNQCGQASNIADVVVDGEQTQLKVEPGKK